MEKFSFDYKGYHVIVNPVVDNIIEAYCDSENDKVLFRIDYREEFEYKDKLIEFIKYSIDLRKNILHKQILSHLYQAALDPINNSYATFRTGRSEKITNDYKTIKKDLEVLEILKKYLKIEPTCYPYRYVYDEEKITLDIEKLNNLSSPSSYKGLASWINNDEFKKVKDWLCNETH